MSSKSNYFSIKLPEYKKAHVDLWRYLNPNSLETLLACFEIDDFDEFLNRLNQSEIKLIHNLKDEREEDRVYKIFTRLISIQLNMNLNDKKDLILIDKYYYLIKFALSNSFNKIQINALISIIKRTHDLAIETSFGNLDETFDYFKSLVLVYGVHRPPFSLSIFTPPQIQLILDYFLKSYFNQFKFYKYVFSPAIRLDLRFEYTNLPIVSNIDLDETRDSIQVLDESAIDSATVTDLRGYDIKEESERDSLEQKQSDKGELREYVKRFLNLHLDKMKNDLIGDVKMEGKGSKPKSNSARSKTPKSPNKNKK